MSQYNLIIYDSGQNYLCLACNEQAACPLVLLRIITRLVDKRCHITLENNLDKVVFQPDEHGIIHLPCFNKMQGATAICDGRDIELPITNSNPRATDITIKFQNLACIWLVFALDDRTTGQTLAEYFREVTDRAMAGT